MLPHPRRCNGAGYLHFITFSCYHRLPLLASPHRRDQFLDMLEEVRRCYVFVVVGYVVMPEHVHLLISEPARGDPSVVIQVLKQRFARRVLRELRKPPSPPTHRTPRWVGQLEFTYPPIERRDGWGNLRPVTSVQNMVGLALARERL